MSNLNQLQLISSDDAEDNVNFGEIWYVLVQHAKTIAAITGVVMLIALAFVLRSHPQFTSTGSLYTGGLKQSAAGPNPANDSASTYLSYLATFQSVSDSETQVDLLTSPVLVQRAILATGLNTSVTNSDTVAPRFWSWNLFHGGNVSAYSPRKTGLEALFTSFTDPSVAKQSYRIVFANGGHYQIVQDGQQILTGTLGHAAAGGGLSLLLQPAAADFTPRAGSSYRLSVADPAITAANIISGPLSVTPGGTATLPSDVINIAFKWSNPYQGTLFINQLMNNYISTIVSWNSGAAGSMVDFISNQLNNVRGQLKTADEKLAAYQRSTGILSPPENSRDAISQESSFEAKRTQAQLQLMALQQIWQALNQPDGVINPYLLSQASDSSLSMVSEKLAEETASLNSLRVQFTGFSPELQTQQAKVNGLRQAVRSMVKNELDEAQNSLNTINLLIAQFQKKIQAMPSQSLQVISLTRSSDVLGQLYVLLMQKQQEAALSEATVVSPTRVLTPAQLPLKASQPKPAIVLAFAFVLGLFGSGLWVLGRRTLSGRFESESEVSRLVKLPVYGNIPHRSKAQSASLLADSAYSAFAEAFRITRNNLYHAIPGKRAKIILLSSAGVGEGKSTVASNLAKSLADDGKSVILVDADLRMGHLHDSLGLEQSPGLSDWLVTGEPAAAQFPASQRFAVLTSGIKPPNPAELINDPTFLKIIKELRITYDFIIFDSAPLPVVSDAITLAKYADLTLSVVQIGHSKHRAMTQHQNVLKMLTRHHGVILNDIPDPRKEYGPVYGSAYSGRHRASWTEQWAGSAASLAGMARRSGSRLVSYSRSYLQKS